jgi:hypothetical protein
MELLSATQVTARSFPLSTCIERLSILRLWSVCSSCICPQSAQADGRTSHLSVWLADMGYVILLLLLICHPPSTFMRIPVLRSSEVESI